MNGDENDALYIGQAGNKKEEWMSNIIVNRSNFLFTKNPIIRCPLVYGALLIVYQTITETASDGRGEGKGSISLQYEKPVIHSSY